MPSSSGHSENSQRSRGRRPVYRGYQLLSDQVDETTLRIIWDNLETVLRAGIAGSIVEFGCYIGTTSLYLRRLLDKHNESAKRELHVYDSFAGLPPKTTPDQSGTGSAFQAGKLSISKKELSLQFYKAGLKPPIIHKGWFEDLTRQDVPNSIAFAFLDGDFYTSILASLRLAWPCMTSGGHLLIDDYGREALPGVQQAVQHFFGNTPINLRQEHNLAIIKHP